jgi:hypothetical protein
MTPSGAGVYRAAQKKNAITPHAQEVVLATRRQACNRQRCFMRGTLVHLMIVQVRLCGVSILMQREIYLQLSFMSSKGLS